MNEHAEITILEKDDYVSFANCGMPYHIGGEIPDRAKLLVATADLLRRRFRLDVRTGCEVTQIDRTGKVMTVRENSGNRVFQLPYDKLILTPGASPIVPNLDGIHCEGVYSLRNIADMDRIRAAVDTSKETQRRAIVIGAGFIGLEMVEQLVAKNFAVSLVELQAQVLPPMDPEMVVPLLEELERHGVKSYFGSGLKRILHDGRMVLGIELENGQKLDGSLVILGMGVRPNTALATNAGLEIGRTGGIVTNAYQQTSDPDIYAAGDAVEYHYGPADQYMRVALAGPANRAGRIAGEHAAVGRSAAMSSVMGTAIVRVLARPPQ